jgi:hypothetical protein
MSEESATQLNFNTATPYADNALGGLVQDHFVNGRMFATVAAHGGITDLSYWGKQHLGAAHFFRGDCSTAWTKLFRFAMMIEGKRHYPLLRGTFLFPFGLQTSGEVEGIQFRYEMLLLRDALVQRVQILKNPGARQIGLEVLHQEAITAVNISGRNWGEMCFHPPLNALVVQCHDKRLRTTDVSLSQFGIDLSSRDLHESTTWIAFGSERPLTARRGYHSRSKHYLKTDEAALNRLSCYTVFSTSEEEMNGRLLELSSTVHEECDRLIHDYEVRLQNRPIVKTGIPVFDSAIGQYPEIIEHLKIHDKRGATRANASGYFVWGWDGMMPAFSSILSNEPEYTAEVLRFFQSTREPEIGFSHAFSTHFKGVAKSSFPAHAQYLCALYLYVATTGNLDLAREVWPTCQFILDRCRENVIGETGLVRGPALWPDFPEAMEENGEDISSLNNSLLYQGLRAVESLAQNLGQDALSSECREWGQRLRLNFIKYLYDSDKGFFISSCSAKDFSPRKHYCAQSIFWLTPFARELVSHEPLKIMRFLDDHLRSPKCLLTLPHWDRAWMADGNQLGSSFPAADYFYLAAHKINGDAHGLATWMEDVKWFWSYHTAPEAFTPEAENEQGLGPDNIGAKQLQALSTWYASAFLSLAGLDFDHEGITINPWGDIPVAINGLKIRGFSVGIRIRGQGRFLKELRKNGELQPIALHKLLWSDLKGSHIDLEWVRSDVLPVGPSIIRADGLRVILIESSATHLKAQVEGNMSGEVIVNTSRGSRVLANGNSTQHSYSSETLEARISVEPGKITLLEIHQ